MPREQDYILRYIALLRQAIAEAMKLRQSGRLEQSLLTILQAEERLFACPATAFAERPVPEQLQMLRAGEPAEAARAKCLGYARLLREAGLVYETRDRMNLAISAFQLALYVALDEATGPGGADAELMDLLDDLLARVPADRINDPVRELLTRYGEGT